MEKHQVEYDGRMIEYIVRRKDVKNVNLNVKPDMTIEISANNKVPDEFISDFVRAKGSWILKHVKGFKEVQPIKQSDREYVSGESYKYLGKQYRLRVVKSEEEKVKYYRGFIYLYVKNPDDYCRKETLMAAWYKAKAEKVFQESLDRMYPLVSKYGVPKPGIDRLTMKARWGSALTDKGMITLNAELIKAPKYCIDYVVLHELIHFRYNDHSDNFYKMVFALMPDWEKRKAILDEEIVREL